MIQYSISSSTNKVGGSSTLGLMCDVTPVANPRQFSVSSRPLIQSALLLLRNGPSAARSFAPSFDE